MMQGKAAALNMLGHVIKITIIFIIMNIENQANKLFIFVIYYLILYLFRIKHMMLFHISGVCKETNFFIL